VKQKKIQFVRQPADAIHSFVLVITSNEFLQNSISTRNQYFNQLRFVLHFVLMRPFKRKALFQ